MPRRLDDLLRCERLRLPDRDQQIVEDAEDVLEIARNLSVGRFEEKRLREAADRLDENLAEMMEEKLTENGGGR